MAANRKGAGRRKNDATKAKPQDLKSGQVDPRQAEQVRGGSVTFQDFHFTQTVSKSSPG